ncbi:MAG TPA: hypothetical protein VFC53_08830 [Dehalococcoidia bacterium]|nr:hypothetical protein [Dehalococcoidia bacterium]
MRLLSRKPAEDEEARPEPELVEAAPEPAAPQPGPEVLRDGPLLARWFIVYELEKELKRAARHERPLSVMVLVPTPTLGEAPSPESVLRAAHAAQSAARSTDLIGWLPGNGILVVMPETDKDGAAAAVNRWRDAMYTSTMRLGAVRWRVATSVNAWEYQTAAALLDDVLARLEPAEKAA